MTAEQPLDKELRRPRLHHVFLKTPRYAAMKSFYTTVLGMQTNFDSPGVAFLTNDHANHRLALLNHPDLHDVTPDHAGIHHQAYEVESIDDLLSTFVRLKAEGITPAMSLDHGPTTSFYYQDPDGHLVELLVANFENDPEETLRFFASPEFSSNPLGVPIDPELVLQARKAGASPQQIHRQGYYDRAFSPREGRPRFAGLPTTMRPPGAP